MTNKDKSSDRNLPEEIIIDDQRYTSPENVATKLNEFRSFSISKIFGGYDTDILDSDMAELKRFVHSKVPNGIYFKIPNYYTGTSINKHLRFRFIQSNRIR